MLDLTIQYFSKKKMYKLETKLKNKNAEKPKPNQNTSFSR